MRNPNSEAAIAIVREFQRSGVEHACISPGSRSAAIVTAILRVPGIKPWVVLDERSAGFFALGMARETGRPVVLVCTSGTAAANYMPAVVEASLSKIPLVVVTADRPPEARDCRSAQTIDQVRMFGSHVRWGVDLLAPSAGVDAESYYRTIACRAVAAATECPAGPVHLNFPMREPLIDPDEERREIEAAQTARPADDEPARVRVHTPRIGPATESVEAIAGKLRGCERGLIVCGPGAVQPRDAGAVAMLAESLDWPVVADPLSALRFGRHDRSRVIDACDVMLRSPEFARRNRPEVVIQLGDPPVSKPLSQFLAAGRGRPHILVAPPGTWPDPLYVATDVVRSAGAEFCSELGRVLGRRGGGDRSAWLEGWQAASACVRECLNQEAGRGAEMSEAWAVGELAGLLPEGTAVHVGNSMPVRYFDTYLANRAVELTIACNRGANGIDGVLSTAMGAAAARNAPTALVLGDVSFLHDIGALHIAARYPIHLLVVVLNNNGGGIFSLLPHAALGEAFETFFATPHGLDFQGAAAMARAGYSLAQSRAEFSAAVGKALGARSGLHVVEVPIDRARSLAAHARAIEAATSRLGRFLGEA